MKSNLSIWMLCIAIAPLCITSCQNDLKNEGKVFSNSERVQSKVELENLTKEFSNAPITSIDVVTAMTEVAPYKKWTDKSLSIRKDDNSASISKELEKYSSISKTKFKPTKCKPLIPKGFNTTFNFDGVDFFVKNNKVVGVKGIALTKTALDVISEKIIMLDRMQTYCCESKNSLFQIQPVNYQAIKELDDKYFTTLLAISQMTNEIRQSATKPNADAIITQKVIKTEIPDTNTKQGKATVKPN